MKPFVTIVVCVQYPILTLCYTFSYRWIRSLSLDFWFVGTLNETEGFSSCRKCLILDFVSISFTSRIILWVIIMSHKFVWIKRYWRCQATWMMSTLWKLWIIWIWWSMPRSNRCLYFGIWNHVFVFIFNWKERSLTYNIVISNIIKISQTTSTTSMLREAKSFIQSSFPRTSNGLATLGNYLPTTSWIVSSSCEAIELKVDFLRQWLWRVCEFFSPRIFFMWNLFKSSWVPYDFLLNLSCKGGIPFDLPKLMSTSLDRGLSCFPSDSEPCWSIYRFTQFIEMELKS